MMREFLGNFMGFIIGTIIIYFLTDFTIKGSLLVGFCATIFIITANRLLRKKKTVIEKK